MIDFISIELQYIDLVFEVGYPVDLVHNEVNKLVR